MNHRQVLLRRREIANPIPRPIKAAIIVRFLKQENSRTSAASQRTTSISKYRPRKLATNSSMYWRYLAQIERGSAVAVTLIRPPINLDHDHGIALVEVLRVYSAAILAQMGQDGKSRIQA